MPEPRKFLNVQRGPSRIVVFAIAAVAAAVVWQLAQFPLVIM